jgi:hypothetical protein
MSEETGNDYLAVALVVLSADCQWARTGYSKTLTFRIPEASPGGRLL